LKKYSPALANRERWLVCTKIDLISGEERRNRCRDLAERLGWKSPIFMISALHEEGTRSLCRSILDFLNQDEMEQKTAR
jgi:GTP-binding protein